MRFNEIISEDSFESSIIIIDDNSKDVQKVSDYIRHKCQQYLSMINPKTDILYRGIENRSHYHAIDITGERKNRSPIDSSTELHNKIDDMLYEQGFVARRSNSWFGTGNFMTAGVYGKVYVAFPTDGFHYTWSDTVSDLFTYYQEHRTKGIDWVVNSIKDSYESDNNSIKNAIQSKNEIMFTSPRVILVEDTFYQDEVKSRL